MCFGGRGSNKDPGRISLSESHRKDGKYNSVLSDPRSRTGASMHSSLMSNTGSSTVTGGGQSMDNNLLMTSPLAGTSTHESDPLPSEVTAKSPKKGSTDSPQMQNKSRERKSIDVNPNIDTWRSTKDEDTLKNLKESRRDMTVRGKDETEQENSEWSVFGKHAKKSTKKRKESGRPFRALLKPRPPPPSLPPPRPSPPIPSIPIQPYRPSPIIPIIPSPSTTPPTFPSLLNQSDEKTAINNQTLRTQRTMMDEETISRMQTPLQKNQKDISYEVETRVPLSTVPPDEGPKLMEESKKLSMREDFKVLEEKTAHLIPEPITKPEMCSKKSTTFEVTQMKG